MNKNPHEINSEELKKFSDYGYLTVGKLLNFLNDKIKSGELTEDSLVLSQRVEDIYFEENEWGVVKKKGEHYEWFEQHNKKIDDGFFNDKNKFPLEINKNEEFLNKISDEQLEESIDQYHPVWCPLNYENDTNLYLNLHY